MIYGRAHNGHSVARHALKRLGSKLRRDSRRLGQRSQNDKQATRCAPNFIEAAQGWLNGKESVHHVRDDSCLYTRFDNDIHFMLQATEAFTNKNRKPSWVHVNSLCTHFKPFLDELHI